MGDSVATYWSTTDSAKTAAQNANAEKMIERMLGKASRARKKKRNEVEVVINLLSGSSRKNTSPHKYYKEPISLGYIERLIPLVPLVTRFRQITASCLWRMYCCIKYVVWR